MSIVIICKSVIGIVSFNLSKTIYIQKSRGLKIFDIVVAKDAFKVIIENGWIGIKGTNMNKDGQTFVFQIAVYYIKTVQVKQFVVGGWWWWMVAVGGCVKSHFSDQLIPI